MADENLKQILKLIATEVARERHHAFDEKKHPRDENGQFIAVDVAAEAAQARHPDAHDDKDYRTGRAKDIERKLRERGLLKKADEPKPLSDTAQRLEGQTLSQLADHGRVHDVPLPRNAEHLFADYKHHPHKPMVSLLKYIVHRVENQHRYDTPADAARADKEFLKSRDTALMYSRADPTTQLKQPPIEHLHNQLAQAPHLVDEVMAHQKSLHDHLAQTGKIKTIDGQPHVALTRGLGHGRRMPDPMLTSFADSHENTLGGRVKFFHNHWVPLKNVWYSYDHGPKASHPSHYFPAQDEFLVSPHKLKTALSTDVKKLVPRKPKMPRPAKTADGQPKEKLASSAEPHKMYTHRDFQHFSAIAALRKSGQYIKLDPAILALGNKAGFIVKDRERFKKELLGRGKLDPKDIDKIIQNRNVHIYNLLLDRADLTKDQLMAMALHKDDFGTRGRTEGNREDEAYNKLYLRLGGFGQESTFDEIAQKGGDVAVQNMLKYAKHKVTGENLMHLVTERKDLDSPTMHKVIAHDKFDNGHLAEILHSPHPDVIIRAVLDADSPPNIIDAALQHENPKVRAGILERGYNSQRLDDRQVIRGLDDQDPDVRKAAATNANTSERARHILDNHLGSPNATEMLDEMLGSGPFGYYRDEDKEKDKDWLDEGDLRRIVDYGIEKDSRILTGNALRKRKRVPADSVMKIMQMQDTKDRDKYEGTPRSQRLKAEWMSHPAVTPDHIDAALATTSDSAVMKAISDHQHASSEQLRQAWSRMPKAAKPGDWASRDNLSGWMTNKNTPTDVLSEAAKIHERTGNVRALISHPNLAPNVLKAFQAHENPQYRAYAAENPNAQADHMTAGLADKDKTVRNAWMNHPGLQPEHLATALKDRAPSNREIVAAHPSMTPELLSQILKKDKSEEVRFAAISNKNATPEMMRDVLMTDPSKKMRSAVLRHAQLTPDLIDHVLKHDSDADIRATMLRHPNLTADHIRHVALNDPNDQIRRMALNHAKADPNLIQDAIEKAPSHALSETLQNNANLKPEHVARLYEASMRHHAALPPVDPNDQSRWEREDARNTAMDTIYKLVQHPSAPDGVRGHFIEHGPINRVAAMVRQDVPKSAQLAELGGYVDEDGKPIQENHTTSLSAAHLLSAHDRMNKIRAASQAPEGTPPARIQELEGLPSALASHDKFKESGLLDRFAHSQDTVERGLAAEHHELPKELVNKLVDDPSHEVRHGVASRKDLDDATVDKLIRKDQHASVLRQLTTNPTVQHDVSRLNRIWNIAKEAGEFWRNEARLPEGADDAYIGARMAVLAHPNVSSQLLQEGIRDHHPTVRDAASRSLAHLEPDAYNQTREGAHDIDVHPATEKLKHLKGQVEEAGGKIHKRDLPGQGQGLPKELFDGQGHMTPQNTEQYLKSLPHQKYNISYKRWKGAQRHSSADQAVIQLNMTNDHVRQLKEQGLFDTFKKMHSMSFSSGHPVDHHSLGWARVDDSHPDHWHIDEIQSDFGQNTIRQVEQMKRQQDEQGGRGRDPSHKPFGNVPLETVIDHLKKINKVFAGGFKNINHAIHAAVHAVGRKKGIKSTSMDKVEDQAEQSGMSSKRDLPGHMINTYQDQPAKDGYTIKPKKSAMPNTDASEEEVQYRKLVKSIQKLRGLVSQYKNTTAGRHSGAPGKEAGGKHAPVAKKPADKKHIRADTQTHLDLKLEKSDPGQFWVHLGLEPSKESTGKYAQWHLTKEQLGHVLKNWHEVKWDHVSASRPSSSEKFHSTAITRNKLSTPIDNYLKIHKPAGRVLYHGVGRDEIGAKALGAEKYDPFHPDPKVRQVPNGSFDEIHSHYTLNVVDKDVGKQILNHIHGLLNDGGKAVISVRRDLHRSK